jgi:hypothetical protein
MKNIDNNFNEDELLEEAMRNQFNETINTTLRLPKIVEEYADSAIEVSRNNRVPAILSAYSLLGQICKEMVYVPKGRGTEDVRVHIIWLQTSGSGKSEMYNFTGRIAQYVFDIINGRHRDNVEAETAGERHNRFSIHAVKSTTDAALIGKMKMEDVTITDDDGNTTYEQVPKQLFGGLEGDGLCVYDEFEYSGVFKPTQHKQEVVMYLNTLMNTLAGQNYRITKQLAEGGEMYCDSRRSIYATSYIPKTLTSVIAETGLLQRCLIYIREVPISEQNAVRETLSNDYGRIIDTQTPINKFGDAFVEIYECLKEQYDSVPLEIKDGMTEEQIREAEVIRRKKVITFSKGVNDTITNETIKFQNFVHDSRPAVIEIANNFITRMQVSMVRLAVLSCIAEAPKLPKKDRFKLTSKHVLQASHVTQQCYKSLVLWLDSALRAERLSSAKKQKLDVFTKEYKKLVENGKSIQIEGQTGEWINKSVLLETVRLVTNASPATVYRNYKSNKEYFEEIRHNKNRFVNIKRRGIK